MQKVRHLVNQENPNALVTDQDAGCGPGAGLHADLELEEEATLRPALRAASINPVDAIRTE